MKFAVALGILIIAIIGVSMMPVRQTENAPFASPAFQRVWNSESASAARSIDLWGSDPLISRVEPFTSTDIDRRTVQYFERGRMELQGDARVVTMGLLARELTTGRILLGDNVFEERQPPEISIDGGELIDEVPTYLTLSRLVGEREEDRSRSGRRITQWIDRSGEFENDTTPEVIRLTKYVEQTGHNLPDVTVDLFARSEFSGDKWVEAFGYPISEPVWTYYRRGDSLLPSLVQVFERRVLVYSPNLETERRFTVTNAGRHYYIWRYGSDLTAELPEIPQEERSNLSLPDGFSAVEYTIDSGTPIDLTLAPSGHLLVLMEHGQILKADSTDPDGFPHGFSVWADGIVDPQGMTTSSSLVLVTTADGVQAFRNEDGIGVPVDPLDSDLDVSAGQASLSGAADQPSEILGFGGPSDADSSLLESHVGAPLLRVSELIVDLGPLRFWEDRILAAGSAADGRSKILVLPASKAAEESDDATTLATFPPETFIHALEVAEDRSWPVSEFGSILVAVEGDDGGSVYALAMSRNDGETELFEFGRGLRRPVAMVFGLDGSLYVADAGLGKIIRIVHDD